MQKLLMHNLFESFEHLERAIAAAKACLLRQQNPSKDIINRLENYEGILRKQRGLALSLTEHSREGNVHEIVRHIKIINGLSALIRDDALEILGALRTPVTPTANAAERELLPC